VSATTSEGAHYSVLLEGVEDPARLIQAQARLLPAPPVYKLRIQRGIGLVLRSIDR